MKSKTLSIFKISATFVLLVLLGWETVRFQQDHTINFSMVDDQFGWLVLALILAPVNLLFESLRWRTAMAQHPSVPIAEAWKTVLTGITIGFITPGRIGDYLGRAIAQPARPTETMTSTWIAGLCQNWVNLFFGLTGMTYLYYRLSISYFIPVLAVALVLLILGSILLFKDSWRDGLIRITYGLVKKYLKFIKIPDYVLTQKQEFPRLKLFLLSALRYLIYGSQYILVAKAFGILAPANLLICIISATLMIQSMIPLPFIAGLLTRAQISVLLWGLIGIDFDKALTVSFVIWMINLLLPSLLGLRYVIMLKPIQENS
jgi:hypothetical protein